MQLPSDWQARILPNALPNGLDPFEDESLAGFVMRLAGNHGFSRPADILKPMGEEFSTVKKSALHAAGRADLAHYLRLEQPELDALSYGEGVQCRVFGHELHRDLMALTERKLCPLCVSERPYHRAIWDLTLILVCPQHSVRLNNRCFVCDHKLDWHVGPITHCPNPRCAADQREAEVQETPAEEMHGTRWLDALIRTGRCSDVGPEVSALSVNDQMHAVFHLGCRALGHPSSTRIPRFVRHHADDMHRIINAGWNICVGWPYSFHEFLDSRREQAGKLPFRYGIRKYFGDFQHWLNSNGQPYARMIEAEITRYLVARPEFATRSHDVRRGRAQAPMNVQAMTVVQACKLLGVGVKAIAALIDEHDLWIVEPTGSGAPALVRADRVHALHQERARLLSKKDVCKLLGTSKRTVEKLRTAGFLPTVPDFKEPDGVRYPVDGVEMLLAGLASRVLGSRADEKTMITTVTIARKVPLPGFDVVDVLHAVRSGELVPSAVRTRNRGLSRFVFEHADVERYIAELTRKPDRTMSIVEAAEKLHVKQEVAYHWVRQGLLETTTRDRLTEAGRRVTEDNLASFRNMYVTGPDFARQHGLPPKKMGSTLLAIGVRPVSGPDVDGGRQLLFRRSDLEKLDPQGLISGRSKLKRASAKTRVQTLTAKETCNATLDAALRREFGTGLTRRYDVFRDEAAGLVIQMMIASNSGTLGTYSFLISERQQHLLRRAQCSWLSLGFVDRQDYLLIPWQKADPVLKALSSYETRYGLVLRLTVRALSDRALRPFGEFCKPYDRNGK